MKKCELIMVTSDNNNKFYNMEECGSSIKVVYGRVGSKGTEVTYPLSKWESLRNQKIKKGYTDITDLKKEIKVSNCKPIEDVEVADIVDQLVSRARTQISDNYLVSYKEVTRKQVNEAQSALNSILEYRKKFVPVEEINNRLLRLYQIIPRKMKNVKLYLLDTFDTARLKELIKYEQDLLDTISTQVIQNEDTTGMEGKTLLELANLTMRPVTKKEKSLILDKLGNNKNQYVRAFAVSQEPTTTNFENNLATKENKTIDYFWHGSRTENWWSILSTGLKIRPSNAVYTGSMMGDGIYFADSAQKSIGYTSLRHSYWASGRDNRAYLALFKVHIGKQYHVYEHKPFCYDLSSEELERLGNFDSTFAHAGVSLKNNEYVIYNQNQCTINYIVEIRCI